MAPNVPEAFEAHFGVPMAGAVLNALNIRLDAETIAFILGHGGAKVLLTDTEFSPVDRPRPGAARPEACSSSTSPTRSGRAASGSARWTTRRFWPRAIPISPG